MVGQRNLHEKVLIVGAGNKITDGAIVEEMSSALMSRMVHLEMEVNDDDWIDWAIENNVDVRITSFIQFKPQSLYDFSPEHSDKTYACPRTWAFVDRILKTGFEPDSPLALPLLHGTVGNVASEFQIFCKIKTHDFKDILKNPEGLSMPTEMSVLFALCGSIAQKMTAENMEEAMKFVWRMPKEFQIVCMRDFIKRNPSLISNPNVIQWAKVQGKGMFGGR